MKKIHLLALFSCLLLASCHPVTNNAKHLMEHAALLVESHPDSTLRLIDSIMRMEARISESDRMNLALLQGKALYDPCPCNDSMETLINESVPIPELDHASIYFAKQKDHNKAALASLYKGHVATDENDKTTAIHAFKEAERYGILANDSLTVARAQFNMGKLLYYDGMEDEAMNVLTTACIGLQRHPVELALALNVLACCQMLRHEYNDAEYNLKHALEQAEEANCDKARQKVLNNMSVMSQLQGDVGNSIQYLKQIVKESDSTQPSLIHLINLGLAYSDFGMMDSATRIFGLIETILPTTDDKPETKVAAYHALSSFFENREDPSKALLYRKLYDTFQYQIASQIENKRIYHIQRRYDYESLHNQMVLNMNKKQRVIIVISAIVVLLLGALTISHFHLAKKSKKEAEYNQRILMYLKQLTDALTKEEMTMQKVAVCMNDQGDKALFEELKRLVFGKQDPWEAMVKVFDALHPGDREQLLKQHPDLSEMEQKDVMLSYFNVSRQEEALLLNTSIYMVDKTRNNVRKKLQRTDPKQETVRKK